MKRNTRAQLSELLQERNEYPDRAAQIDAKVSEIFGQTHAVLVMDMSGFSRLTIKHGIMHFLAMIHRMQAIVVPAIKEHGGEVIKTEADNVFAIFPEVKTALETAIDITRRLSAANTMLPDEMDMHGKFGIGYGELLILEDEDLSGAKRYCSRRQPSIAWKPEPSSARKSSYLSPAYSFSYARSSRRAWRVDAH
jgi:adenylate cyclase